MPIGNYTVGKSNIYIMVPKIGSTLYKMGNITVGEVTPDNTYVEHYISDRGARRKDKEVAVTKGINVTFTFDEINSTNLDRFVLGSLISPVSVVLNEETIECKAVVDFRTNVGKSFRYVVPKSNLKADGGLPLTAEDWMSANMMLEGLHHSTYKPGKGKLASPLAPFGFLHLSALHSDVNATYF